MKILIVYATTEGQTERIAQFMLDCLTGLGHSVALMPAASARAVAISSYDGVIVAGSVHAGRYQKALRKWVRATAKELSVHPTLFVSVSLCAAGDDVEDWRGLEDCVARFVEATGWTPTRVEHVAGAFRFSEYDFFRTWAMRWIAAQKGQEIAPGEDREYTDWEALRALVGEWTETLAAGK